MNKAIPAAVAPRMSRLDIALSLLVVAAGLGFGLNFLLNPQGAASGFGIEPWPQGAAAGYFIVKGVRDIAYALVALVLLLRGHRRTLGWVVLVNAIIPIGDCIAVLTHGGTVATALSIHGSAVVLVLFIAAMLLRRPAAA